MNGRLGWLKGLYEYYQGTARRLCAGIVITSFMPQNFIYKASQTIMNFFTIINFDVKE
jgi:hypothetical protein